jgi:inner membrane protein
LDNLCHTLTGAALAEAGLKHRTRFGSAALMIAANLPDVDVLVFLTDTPAVAFRRGWTHGVVAQALLPIVLTGIFVVLDRWLPDAAGGRRVRSGAMLLLGYAGVFSHVGLDWLNTYGVRLLMPLSSEWLYGDSVFIVDPWLWLVLAAGVIVARRRRRVGAARTALGIAAIYVAIMVMSARAARELVVDAWTAAKDAPPVRVMVGPVPVNPLRKTVIIDAGDHYERGSFGWWPKSVRFDPVRTPKHDRHPAAVRASTTDPGFRGLLVWSRFPYYEIADEPDGRVRVTLGDMRFSGRAMFTATTVVDSW